ncbi:MAG: cupin domain-containing protein [Lamprobacter sp.]|uniref:cupin domain-containing protein n=1 Tax=Lamprobacter sp. TaxID=3100796 RepID=UPI002B25E1D1|nr:cupin domain-containing protein [Lamprobacter sp.]MEA3639011.1 cupin domain-containing protein [Lamprobacter sp.]
MIPGLIQRGHLFAGLPSPATGEVFEELLRCRNLRIERITSSGKPEPVLYDQAHDEWVLLLSGEARLEIAGEAITLSRGDYIFIPAHTPHRVLQTAQTSVEPTSADPGCTWLAIHLEA